MTNHCSNCKYFMHYDEFDGNVDTYREVLKCRKRHRKGLSWTKKACKDFKDIKEERK